LLVGKLTGNPEGVINEDVNMKNTNSRKIRSVMDAMLKLGSTLFLELKFMVFKF